MTKIRHQLTLDEECTTILKNVDNKSGFTEEAIKYYSKKELHEKVQPEIPRAKILEIRKR